MPWQWPFKSALFCYSFAKRKLKTKGKTKYQGRADSVKVTYTIPRKFRGMQYCQNNFNVIFSKITSLWGINIDKSWPLVGARDKTKLCPFHNSWNIQNQMKTDWWFNSYTSFTVEILIVIWIRRNTENGHPKTHYVISFSNFILHKNILFSKWLCQWSFKYFHFSGTFPRSFRFES